MNRLFFNLLATMFSVVSLYSANLSEIDLSGEWRFQLDPMDFGRTPGSEIYLKTLPDIIMLPGSTDTGKKGIKNINQYVDRLSRKYEYEGPAWYQRDIEIPEEWSDRLIKLELERCHWETTVWLDGVEIGKDERLSTPNRFYFPENIQPGKHTLTICVDNTIKYPMDKWTHGITEYTQTNWNGIVGKIALGSMPSMHITDIQIYPKVNPKQITVKVETAGVGVGKLDVRVLDNDKVLSVKSLEVKAADSLQTRDIELILPEETKLWDEFSPNLYELEIALTSKGGVDLINERFGLREVEQGAHHIKINGNDVHLRGSLECAVFPLTGYPATDVESWKKIMNTIKEYGMNHVRFHSWCPPDAAFTAADETGVYLQVELPMWIKDVGKDPARREFFEKEMLAILDEYGNHPSFILYCNGNENEGDFSVLEDLIKKGKLHDSRHLYSASTARTHVDADEYYVSHVSPKGWITVYEGKPSTNWDVNENSDIDVPVIAHETGQRCMYPNFEEQSKYTGVLEPRNFAVFQSRLEQNGMGEQSMDFFKATGAHTIMQYKAVNEVLLGSENSGGFQLLGLTDFPGQGSAFVGVLDPFWESKGLVDPAIFRESCGPVVALAKFDKRIYKPDEKMFVRFDIYNFGDHNLKRGKFEWVLKDSEGNQISSGKINQPFLKRGKVDSIGSVEIQMPSSTKAEKYVLHARTSENHHNQWDLWVYPEQAENPDYISDWQEAKQQLENGENVLFVPMNPKGRKTHFASHFWNPIMFNWDPMIVGTLINENSGAFKNFPTETYANWQWADILNHATALELNAYKGIKPVIQSIDSYEHNMKLGIAFESKVGNGNLFVLCVDPSDLENRLATKQLLHSVSDYVKSDSFKPESRLSPEDVESIIHGENRWDKMIDSEVIKHLLNKE